MSVSPRPRPRPHPRPRHCPSRGHLSLFSCDAYVSSMCLLCICVLLCVLFPLSCVLCTPTRSHVGIPGADVRHVDPHFPDNLPTHELAYHRMVAMKVTTTHKKQYKGTWVPATTISTTETQQQQQRQQQQQQTIMHMEETTNQHKNQPLNNNIRQQDQDNESESPIIPDAADISHVGMAAETIPPPMFDLSVSTGSVVDVSGGGAVVSISPSSATGIGIVSDVVRGYCLSRLRSTSPTTAAFIVSSANANAASVSLSQSYTKSLWVRISDYQWWGQIMSAVGDNDADESGAHMLYIEGNGIITANHNPAAGRGTRYQATETGVDRIPYNTWTHIAVTYQHSTGTLQIYRNGVLTATRKPGASETAWATWNGGRAISIGNMFGNMPFAGCVDRVQLYSQTLTQQQIQQIITQTQPGATIPTITTLAPTPTPAPTTPPTVTPTTVAPTTVAPTTPAATTVPPTVSPYVYDGPPTLEPIQTPPSAPAANPITYRANGLVMTQPINVYLVFYGAWSTLDPAALTLIPEFVSNLGGSSLWNSGSPYYQIINGIKSFTSTSVTYKGYATDNYSYGTTLADSAIYYIIKNAIATGTLPPMDPQGIYLVLTAPDVHLSSGLCTSYCGWHTSASLSSKRLRYGVVGSSIRCSGCLAPSSYGTPNNARNADSMISVVWHELIEVATDPDLASWLDGTGYENADKCAWNYGQTYIATNGARANVKLGNKDYLVQTNWATLNDKYQYCVNHW